MRGSSFSFRKNVRYALQSLALYTRACWTPLLHHTAECEVCKCENIFVSCGCTLRLHASLIHSD
jgi:hypothetical protein